MIIICSKKNRVFIDVIGCMSVQQAQPAAAYQLSAYGNEPITMVPTTMPAGQVNWARVAGSLRFGI